MSSKKTLTEDVIRLRTLMNLPVTDASVIKEGLEEEGFGRNLVAGVGLALMSLLPGVMSAQNATPSADGAQTQQAATNRPIDEAQLEQALMRLKDQGFTPQEGWDAVTRALDSTPNSKWVVVDASGTVSEQVTRSVQSALNALENKGRPNLEPADYLAGQHSPQKGVRFLLMKPANNGSGKVEVVGVMVVQQAASFSQGQQSVSAISQSPIQ